MDPGAKWRSHRGIGHLCRDAHSARRAENRQPPVSLHERPDGRQLDRLVLADEIGRKISRKSCATARAFIRTMINRAIECLAQSTAMPFMPRFRAARP
jgi:hypothetical protein